MSVEDDHPVPEWMLSPFEERELRKQCQEQTNEKCKEKFLQFGECAQQHQVLFSWKCADLKRELLDCVAFWGSQDKFMELRDQHIAEKQKALGLKH